MVGALVDDKTYPDPDYGTNLKSLPGMDYSTKTFFRAAGHAEGQSVPVFVVVPNGVYGARGV